MKHTNFIVSKDKDTTIVKVTGDLSLHNIELLHGQFKEYFEKLPPHTHVQVSDIENIDLSSIQLFLSLKKTAEEQNKHLTFTFKLPPTLETILNNAGFENTIQQLSN